MYEMVSVLERGLLKVSNKIKPDVISHIMRTKGYKTLTNKRKIDITNAVNCVIHNTFKGYCVGRKKVGVTLRKGSFSKNIINGSAVKNNVSYTYTLLVLDALEDLGYIFLNKGGRSYDWVRGSIVVVESECSYIEFTIKLTDLYKNYKNVFKQKVLLNVLEIRDKKKEPKVFKQTSETKLVKGELINYNTLSITQAVTSPSKVVYDCQIKKIFNESLKKGGRSFMTHNGIQHLTKQERRDLTINGNETVIYDYKAFEPSIAYSVNQELMKNDPYQLDWEDYDKVTLRALGKATLTVMLYASDKQVAYSAVNHNISENFDVDVLYEEGLIPSPVIPVRRLVEAIEEKNKGILSLMYNPTEHNLSNLGSLIMDYIVNYFTQRSICVLPVFDEVIIEKQHETKLVEVMDLAYESVLGFTDNCYIEKEK